jgi:hypothetical protein
MTAPGPTIKSFQKRLYTVLPRGVAATRVRSNSAGTSSRALHNYSPSLPYFDPSTPPPSSRPGNPHLLSTTRLPIEARTEPEAPNSQHTHTGHAPPSSLALTSPHSSNSVSSSQNGIPLANFHAPPFFLYQPCTPPSSVPLSAVLDSCSLPPHASTSKLRFHFDVGAYGIPKFRPSNVISGRDGVGGADLWSHNSKLTEGLDLAVQVGEDAYFVRDNAMGVADGVGGWSRTRVLSISFSQTRHIYPGSRFPQRRPISVGALCPSSHALLFRRGSGTGFHPYSFFPRCAAVIKDDVPPCLANSLEVSGRPD